MDDPDPAPGFRQLASFRLQVLAHLSLRLHETRCLARLGLSLTECHLIGLAAEQSEIPFRDVCRESNLEKSRASKVISSLIARGLLAKRSDPADRRNVIVRLTERGRAAYALFRAAITELNEALLAS